MTEGLPPLYTLSEVAEATKYSVRHVARVLRRCPSIRPVGNGRGTRLTLEDYKALVEEIRCRSNLSRLENGRETDTMLSEAGSSAVMSRLALKRAVQRTRRNLRQS
jgi:hypothetical protein